jgi:hypothetical protein
VRVNPKGLNASRVCESKETAKDAESELRAVLRQRADQTTEDGAQPATLKALFEHYVEGLAHRGKSSDTVTRAARTATVLEALLPELRKAPDLVRSPKVGSGLATSSRPRRSASSRSGSRG